MRGNSFITSIDRVAFSGKTTRGNEISVNLKTILSNRVRRITLLITASSIAGSDWDEEQTGLTVHSKSVLP